MAEPRARARRARGPLRGGRGRPRRRHREVDRGRDRRPDRAERRREVDDAARDHGPRRCSRRRRPAPRRSIRVDPPRRSRAGVALVPEGRRIFADFTRRGEPAPRTRRRRANGTPGARWRRSTSCSRCCASSRRRSAGALSGGQQQQLAIGRALVARPEVLLLDEPSLGLAPTVVDNVFDALARIRERGVTILLVEQRASAPSRSPTARTCWPTASCA